MQHFFCDILNTLVQINKTFEAYLKDSCILFMFTIKSLSNKAVLARLQGFFQQFWEKAPGQKWEKMIDLIPNWEKLTT